MISIFVSSQYRNEKHYIIDVIFNEFLGLEYQIELNDNAKDYEITFDNKNLIIRDHFFNRFINNEYLDQANIPERVTYLSNQFIPEQDIPIIYGNDELLVSLDKLICGIDLFASSFFMLTRWEEYVNKTRDQHERFPASASLAYKNNFLLRPVVNEYVEMLWKMLVALGYKGKRKKRKFKIEVSHDVDCPFQYYFQSPIATIKPSARALLKEKEPIKAIIEPFKYIASKINPEKYDRFYTFNLIMDISDQNNLISSFYFITDHSAGKIDGDYDIFHSRIQKLLKHIDKRGHEIGLHGSYNSYNDRNQYKKEWHKLIDACQHANVMQLPRGSRQHFLRYEAPESFNVIEESQVRYDTTLSYADHIGFRCGVCYEFSVFDFLKREALNLYENPLILMECTLLDYRYMKNTAQTGLSVILELKNRIKFYSGVFSILWHNNRFINDQDIELYRNILKL